MKKLILPILVCLFAFGSTNANTFKTPTTKISNGMYSSNVNAFCKLIQMGDFSAVKSLIAAGENVNKKSNGLTPLMFAARHNKAEIAKLLIENGAKLNVKSERGNMTALEMAKRSKAKDAIEVIKAAL